MRYELRPMSIGAILDRALRVYLQNFGLLLSLSLTISVPTSLAYLWAGAAIEDRTAVAMVLFGLNMLVAAVTAVLLQGALVQAVSDAFLGADASYGRSFRLALSRFFPLLIFSIVYGILVAMGTVMCILPGLFFTAAFFAGSPAVILERKGPLDALARSWHLTDNARRRTFGAIAFAQYAVAGFPAQTVQVVFQQVLEVDELRTMAAVQLASALVQPYFSVVVILLYYDLRVRREAFDLEVLAREIGASPAGASAK